MNPITHSKIQGWLEAHTENNIAAIRQNDPGLFLSKQISSLQTHPFYSAIVPEVIRDFSNFTQMMYSTLEHTFIACAYYIAQDFHDYAETNIRLTGPALVANLHEIGRQLAHYKTNFELNSTSGIDGMIESVLATSGKTADTRDISARFDLFVRTRNKAELLFQFLPLQFDSTTYLKAIQNIFHLHLLQSIHALIAPRAFIVIPSDPDYSDRDTYPSDKRIIFGDKFWSLIGGPGTYQELLEIYQYVGKVNSKRVVDALAFGF